MSHRNVSYLLFWHLFAPHFTEWRYHIYTRAQTHRDASHRRRCAFVCTCEMETYELSALCVLLFQCYCNGCESTQTPVITLVGKIETEPFYLLGALVFPPVFIATESFLLPILVLVLRFSFLILNFARCRWLSTRVALFAAQSHRNFSSTDDDDIA